MATSGTFAYEPSVAEWCDEAFERCGLDPAELTVRHLRSARRSLNLMFSEWPNRGVKLWAVDQVTLDLIDGTAGYNTASGTICILDAVLRRSGVDVQMFPMSRSEYAAIPDKTTEGMPNRFYLDRAITTPTIKLWPVPENSTDDMLYWRVRRLEDVGNPSNTLDVASRWFEPVASGLAAKLAVKFAPARLDKLMALAENSFAIAHREERERGDTQMTMGRS